MTDQPLIDLIAIVGLLSLCAYVVLGGADFGGGVWDLVAAGPRKLEQRDAIAHAMGPVWEANHVWLVFVIVLLFNCFPHGYRVLSEALFVPFHLALLGIMLRGAAFIFRGYSHTTAQASSSISETSGRSRSWSRRLASLRGWGMLFGGASVISPFLLGAAFGAVSEGGVRVAPGGSAYFAAGGKAPWLTGLSIACGLLALSACAYLAAVYLVAETRGALRNDFRHRAILAGTATAVLAGIVLLLARTQATWFYDRLVSRHTAPALIAGTVLFGLSAWAVFGRRAYLAPIFAAGEVVLMLGGWGIATYPYLIYPDVTLTSAAAPAQTLRFMAGLLPLGALLLFPSLWLLFHIFKRGEFQSAIDSI